MAVQYQPYEAKSMLNRLRHVDDWFWTRYTVNPYRGCTHHCVYCDARANQYRLTDTFDERIFVKENAVDVLERQLLGVKRDVVGMGGVCDSYQPIERERGLTRGVVKTLSHHRFPVQVLTKSDLALRDLELYRDVNRNTWACVFFTITTFDGEIASRFEPGAPSPERRLAALAEVAKAGLTTGVAMMPLLPGICDDDEHIAEVVQRVKDAGGQFVLGAGLTLKAGVQRDRYMAFLGLHYPRAVALHEKLYSDGFEMGGKYGIELLRRVREISSGHDIADRMARPVWPDDPLSANKRIAETLLLRAYDLALEGAKTYRVWAYRKAGWAIDEIEENIESIYRREGTKGLQGIKGVGKSLATEIEGWLQSGL